MSNNNKMEGLDVGYYYLDKIGLMRKDEKRELNKGVDKGVIEEGIVEDGVVDKGVVEEGIVEDGVVDYNDSRELFGRKGIVDQHNCYAYAFLYSFIHNKHKPQPGEFAHTYSNKNTHKNTHKCYPYFKNIKNDNPHIYTTLKSHCKKPYYHIFFTKEEGEGDYHFYKMDKDGYWSHKPGSTPIKRTDESGKRIKDPLTADRGRYKIPCFYACVNPLFSRAVSND